MLNFNKFKQAIPLVLTLLISLVLIACYPEHNQSTFDAAGPVAEKQLNVFWWILIGAAIVFVIVEAALAYSIIKYRRKDESETPKQTHGNAKLELVWTTLPALMLIIIAIPTINTLFYAAEPPKHALEQHTLQAIGHQWWFEFRYPSPSDENKEIVTANEVYIPVGYPISIELDSVDVIHSFWVPKLAGKVDMVPAEGNKMWFEADEPGVYYGQCAEYCGDSHANMRFRVVAVPENEFNDWLAYQSAPAIESPDALALSGQEVFKSAGCSGCHALKTVVNKGSKGRIGPNLTHVASRRHLAAGVLTNSEDGGPVNDSYLQDNLRNWIKDPNSIKPGNIMSAQGVVYTDPDRKLTEEEISALVGYLTTLK